MNNSLRSSKHLNVKHKDCKSNSREIRNVLQAREFKNVVLEAAIGRASKTTKNVQNSALSKLK